MFRTRPVGAFRKFVRHYAKLRNSHLLQDVDSIPVHEFKKTPACKKRIYGWGLAETGALGDQKSAKKHTYRNVSYVQHPTRLKFGELTDVIDVACGYGFSAFAVRGSDEFTLFGTGINTDSQIGSQTKRGQPDKLLDVIIYPVPIELPKNDENEVIRIKQVAAGRAHLLALSDSNVLFTMGNNSYGQCGRPIVEQEKSHGNSVVHRIENIENIKNIVCGQDHSLVLTQSGDVFACGWGADGQTGLGSYDSVWEPSLIMGDISSEKIVKVASSCDFVLALNDKGEVFGWGNAEYGQIEAIGDHPQFNTPKFILALKGIGKIVDIATGGSYCLVLNENGDVFIWGYGILGLGPKEDHSKEPKQIPATLFGRNEINPNCKVTSISSGITHVGAVNDQNDLFMWGKNKFGCLGFGNTKDQFFPLKVGVSGSVVKLSCGVDHTLALCKPFI